MTNGRSGLVPSICRARCEWRRTAQTELPSYLPAVTGTHAGRADSGHLLRTRETAVVAYIPAIRSKGEIWICSIPHFPFRGP